MNINSEIEIYHDDYIERVMNAFKIKIMKTKQSYLDFKSDFDKMYIKNFNKLNKN